MEFVCGSNYVTIIIIHSDGIWNGQWANSNGSEIHAF